MSGDSNFSGSGPAGPGVPSAGHGLVDDLAARVRLFEVPGRLRTSLAADFASWASARRPAPLRERLMARLAFDGSAAAMAAGLRGGAAVGRELLFECELAEVALHVDDAGDVALVDGQVLPVDESGSGAAISVELWHADGSYRSTDADDAGSFVFDAVAPGTYQLVVTIGDDEIVLGPLDVAVRA